MKTRLLGGIAALLVAIVGTVLLVTYVQNADKRALASTETENIYIVQKTIPAGASADDDRRLRGQEVRSEARRRRKQRDGSRVPGRQGLRRSPHAGRAAAVLAGWWSKTPSLGPARVQVPTGLQELTLKLPIERVAGGVLKAGDTVGVFLSLEDAGAARPAAKRARRN